MSWSTPPGADLLLLDLDMPGAVGLDPLIRLRERHPRLPIAIVSANEDPLLMRRARALGVAGYLPKSVGPTPWAPPSCICWTAAPGIRRPAAAPAGPAASNLRSPPACANSRRSSSACCGW